MAVELTDEQKRKNYEHILHAEKLLGEQGAVFIEVMRHTGQAFAAVHRTRSHLRAGLMLEQIPAPPLMTTAEMEQRVRDLTGQVVGVEAEVETLRVALATASSELAELRVRKDGVENIAIRQDAAIEALGKLEKPTKAAIKKIIDGIGEQE